MWAAYGMSDCGLRPNNEDYFISDPGGGIFILADGMGGSVGGELAARLGTERVYQYLHEQETRNAHILERAFLEANEAVCNAAAEDPDLHGMGTTLVAALAVPTANHDVHICSVGDSRAYLLSDRQFIPITRDQSWVVEIGEQLGLTDEAMNRHPMRHVLTMAVGCTRELRVHSHLVHMHLGDQILLCSDGLHTVVDEETICRSLISEKSLDQRCHYLIEAAKAEGGRDNITVVVIEAV